MTPKNSSLIRAAAAKEDEFYTQLSDIEDELQYYEKHFKGKIIFCNCDDPNVSNFFHFFSYNFERLKLKKLITTCYKNQQMSLFSQGLSERAIYLEYDGMKKNNKTRVPIQSEIKIKHLKEDGDFRNEECIKILKKSDIVVTNPPFSLFRNYIAQLVEYNKKFIVIGNKNAISYKEVFKLIKENRMWVGVTPMSKDMLFDVPKTYANKLVKTKKKGSGYKIVDGVVKARSQSVWFTNLDFPKRHEDSILREKYIPKQYPKFDNYNAISVNTTKNIPMDYRGAMGVPITFLDKFNPDQFEIIGNDVDLLKRQKDKRGRFYVKDVRKYARIVIKRKKR